MKTHKTWNILLLLTGILFSCSDFVNIDPPRDEITAKAVFTDNASATSAISGIYSEMARPGGFISGTSQSIYVLSGLSADEFVHLSTDLSREQFFNNSILADNNLVLNALWQPAYTLIYYTNSLLEGLKASMEISENVKKQLEGEAKFVRAFCYFYLVNLFGEVPVITTTDFETNRLVPRASVEHVYQQIIEDLKEARELLAADYSFSNNERIRPIKGTAMALLARVYLFTGDWARAEAQSTAIIDNTIYSLLSDLNEVFQANNKEAIWQLKPVNRNNTLEATIFIPANEESAPTFVSLAGHMLHAFEEKDNRLTDWVGEVTTPAGDTFYYPFKYKINDFDAMPTEYSTVFRLAEQYLIRAEARSKQGNITGALEDINAIRRRAGLQDIAHSDREALLNAVLQERYVELFSEGHRWLDLKRTGKAHIVLGNIKTDWQFTDALYPLPLKELESNPNLTQNGGY